MGQTNKQCVSVALLGNAGVMLQYEGIKILLDGLYLDDSGLFSNIPQSVLNRLLYSKNEFSDIDYLLFSHCHPDHFNKQLLFQFLLNHSPKQVVLPAYAQESRSVISFLNEKQISFTALNNNGKSRVFSFSNNLYVTALPTVHMGNQFAEIPHFSYLFTMGMRNILFLADAACNAEHLQCIAREPIDSVFVTPLFFHDKVGQNIIKEMICPNQIFIYHMPFIENDKNGYYKMMNWDLKKWTNSITVTLFSEKEQVLQL